jgi:hypothetical protein
MLEGILFHEENTSVSRRVCQLGEFVPQGLSDNVRKVLRHVRLDKMETSPIAFDVLSPDANRERDG